MDRLATLDELTWALDAIPRIELGLMVQGFSDNRALIMPAYNPEPDALPTFPLTQST